MRLEEEKEKLTFAPNVNNNYKIKINTDLDVIKEK
jgi:hypothetical protein